MRQQNDICPAIKSQQGSIGIGAMIVFIALILVAAVASSVIMETIEKLKDNGESTSSDVRATVNTKPRPTSITIIGESNDPLECASENDFCDFVGTKTIRYISINDPTKFVDLQLNDGTPCTNTVFGDPHVGVTKKCYLIDSKELLLTWQMTPGSTNILAKDVYYVVFCGGSEALMSDTSDMVDAGMTFLDGTNLAGEETSFAVNDVIETGMKYRVTLLLYSCIPSIGDEMSLILYVDGGGSTVITMYFASIDIGHKLY
ncbi:MAG: hypothetical protein HOJ64_03845 [Euryarchaeota archaeon]|jgi:hypothetical protein|nr:hypothetical protein [Euryarchaeota archaeon]MBT4803098.1 hypothetical protein [Euryarchaeota archaeon]MBT5613985.1 hypothetical protein [Euryarchaeota archaeon]MBT6684203.1 hypothetical protein [Euryarchaeota archaeon]MBT6874097.1 hypothetical protein [Euryarchaeota archaeon]